MDRAGVQAADTTEQISERTKHAEEGTTMMPGQTIAGNAWYLASVIVPRTSSTERYHRTRNSYAGAGTRCQTSGGVGTGGNGLLPPLPAAGYLGHVPEASCRPGAGTVSPGEYSSTDPAGRSPCASGRRRRSQRSNYARVQRPISPARLPRTRTLQEGADPLLGILGVFNHLPAHMRVVTQLALTLHPDVVAHLSPQVRRTSPRTGTPDARDVSSAMRRQTAPARSNWWAWACWSRCS